VVFLRLGGLLWYLCLFRSAFRVGDPVYTPGCRAAFVRIHLFVQFMVLSSENYSQGHGIVYLHVLRSCIYSTVYIYFSKEFPTPPLVQWLRQNQSTGQTRARSTAAVAPQPKVNLRHGTHVILAGPAAISLAKTRRLTRKYRKTRCDV